MQQVRLLPECLQRLVQGEITAALHVTDGLSTNATNVQESDNNEVDMSDNDPILLETFMRFLYEGGYDVPQAIMEDGVNMMNPAFHAAMYAIGDKYQASTLKDYAITKYERSLKGISFNTAHLLQRAPVIYSLLPHDSALKRPLINAITDRIPRILTAADIKDSARQTIERVYQEALAADAGFAVAVTLRLSERLSLLVGYNAQPRMDDDICSVCAQAFGRIHGGEETEPCQLCDECEIFVAEEDGRYFEQLAQSTKEKMKDMPFYYVESEWKAYVSSKRL